MRILFLTSFLNYGGAEGILSAMANYWVREGWGVTILPLDTDAILSFYNLDSLVRHVPLGISGESGDLISGLWNNLKRILALRKGISQSKAKAVINGAASGGKALCWCWGRLERSWGSARHRHLATVATLTPTAWACTR